MSNDASQWKRCSSCRKDIAFSTAYWVCSVSTCNRKRTGMVFCSVACWEVHLPMMRHRESYAVEKRSPNKQQWEAELAAASAPSPRSSSAGSSSSATSGSSASGSAGPVVRRSATSTSTDSTGESENNADSDDLPRDILVVVSKLKKYIRQRSGMSTSESVLEPLSDRLRALCNEAIRNAGKDGRRTVMGRDIPKLK